MFYKSLHACGLFLCLEIRRMSMAGVYRPWRGHALYFKHKGIIMNAAWNAAVKIEPDVKVTGGTNRMGVFFASAENADKFEKWLRENDYFVSRADNDFRIT